MIREQNIGVGLIGYGFAGKTFHTPLIQAVDGLALKAIASSDAAKVRKDFPGMTVYADPAALMLAEGVELVVIATPNTSHAPLARAALTAGRAVVIDKPFTLDMAEARDLIALAETQGKLLSVFHNRRWDSDFLAAKFGVESGVLGRVTHFESHIDRFRPEVRDRWRERAEPGAGVWYDLAPHMIDQALVLFGLPQSVQADFLMQRPGAQAVDWAHAVLDYPHHRVVLHASMIAAGGSP
ncbi:MAG TPA: oxidoreductase, partial [Rhizomicrobium sp.]